MKILRTALSPVLTITLFFLYTSAPSEDLNELSVTGGFMYSSWAESDSSIRCALTLETPAIVPSNRYPVQVVMLIDASLEMEGAAIQHAKTAAKNIVDRLSDTDLFGLVTYNFYAREVISLQPLNPNNRRNALNAINRLKYEKGRNLSEGFKKATEQFSRFKGQRSSGQFIILCTNGDAADGITDPDKLLSLVETLTNKNDIHISTIGYDRFFDENFLIGCAERTGGRAYFIEEENITDLSKIVSEEIRRITQTFATNVIIDITLPKGSTLENLAGGTMKNNTIVIGTIQCGIKLPVFFDVNHRPQKRKDLVVNADYMDPVKMTPRKARLYLDIPIGSGEHTYDENGAPLLLEHDIRKGLADAVEQIKNNESPIRKELASSFKDTIIKLERDNVILRSDDFAAAIEYFKKAQRDIENSAIEDELLTKRLKYKYLEMLYGKLK